MKLVSINGSMYSGKTTELIRMATMFKRNGINYIILKPKKDNRYTMNDVIYSHDGKTMECIKVDTLMSYKTIHEVILIDEGHFFEDEDVMMFYKHIVIDHGKQLIIAGLLSTFELKPFTCLTQLLHLAEEIIQLYGICRCCKEKATFTKRLTLEKKKIVVGGDEIYASSCRKCHTKDIKSFQNFI